MAKRLLLGVAGLAIMVALFLILRPGDAAPPPQERQVAVTIAGGTMSPAQISARQGDTLVLQLSAEGPVSFHLHGYDLAQELAAGIPATLRFVANLGGSFEIEDETTATPLGNLVVEPR